MFMLGGDTEVILTDVNGHPKSAIGLIGGTKTDPRKTDNGFVQEDNVLAEFNINPAKSEAEFVQNTKLILQDLDQIIKPLDLSVQIKASSLFNDKELKHPLAQLAGCEPDYDAWELRVNDKPELGSTNLRSCGGHLHISFDRANETPYTRADLCKILDLVAAVPSIMMDTDTDRRSLYGKAGCHRPKYINQADPYDGVEYRTLSNFWIKTEKHMGWAYRAVERAIKNFDELLDIANANKVSILNAVNGSDKKEAEKLINKYDLEVVNA